MRMSISTTSGSRRPALWIASWPLDASPTTSRSSWFSSTSRKPARTSDWSSAIRTRMLTRLHRQPGADAEPAGRAAADVERAAVERDPLAHPDQAVAAAVARRPRGGPRPSSATSSSTARRVVADDDRGAARRRRAWPRWRAPPARSGRRRGRRRPGAPRGRPRRAARPAARRRGRAAASASTLREARGAARRVGRPTSRPSSASASRGDALDQLCALGGARGVALDDARRRRPPGSR